MIETILLIVLGFLMAGEIIAIIINIVSILKLKKEVNQLDKDLKLTFDELFAKIKALVELFLQAQIGKLSDIKIESDKFAADLHVKKKNE